MSLAARRTHSTPLSLLFSRYVSGEIPDASWTGIVSALDESETTTEERLALAHFFNDACTDLGPSAVKVPALMEVEDYVEMLRAA